MVEPHKHNSMDSPRILWKDLDGFNGLSAAQGDLIYVDANLNPQFITPGTNGQIFTTGGVGANPSWTTNNSLTTGFSRISSLNDGVGIALIRVSGFPARKNLIISLNIKGAAAGNDYMTFNNDTSLIYGYNAAINNRALIATVSTGRILFPENTGTYSYAATFFVANNFSTSAKRVTGHSCATSGMTQPISAGEIYGIYGDTTAQITEVAIGNDTQAHVAGSTIDVYGSDI